MPVAEKDYIHPELLNVGTPNEEGTDERFKYSYWRRKDGYITIAPSWAVEYMMNVKTGMQPLDAYGEFTLSRSPSQNFDAHHENGWRVILANGGAKEFPVEQIREYGWDKKAPLGLDAKPLDLFPQLVGEDLTRFKCAHCRRDFITEDDRSKHEQIAHARKSDQTELARQLAAANQANQGPMTDLLTMMGKAIIGLQNSQEKLAESLEKLANRPTR